MPGHSVRAIKPRGRRRPFPMQHVPRLKGIATERVALALRAWGRDPCRSPRHLLADGDNGATQNLRVDSSTASIRQQPRAAPPLPETRSRAQGRTEPHIPDFHARGIVPLDCRRSSRPQNGTLHLAFFSLLSATARTPSPHTPPHRHGPTPDLRPDHTDARRL